MEWVDVFGVPGAGKSSILDDIWPPNCIEGNAPFPVEWSNFIVVVAELLGEVKDHPSYSACESMVARSMKKLANVAASTADRVYIQTGFAQRGLGFGWRLDDPSKVKKYYETMPISIGVILLECDEEVAIERNIQRGLEDPKKDRSDLVPLMQESLEVAKTALRHRGAPFLVLNTEDEIHFNQQRILSFAGSSLKGARSTIRYCHQSSVFPSSMERRRSS